MKKKKSLLLGKISLPGFIRLDTKLDTKCINFSTLSYFSAYSHLTQDCFDLSVLRILPPLSRLSVSQQQNMCLWRIALTPRYELLFLLSVPLIMLKSKAGLCQVPDFLVLLFFLPEIMALITPHTSPESIFYFEQRVGKYYITE